MAHKIQSTVIHRAYPGVSCRQRLKETWNSIFLFPYIQTLWFNFMFKLFSLTRPKFTPRSSFVVFCVWQGKKCGDSRNLWSWDFLVRLGFLHVHISFQFPGSCILVWWFQRDPKEIVFTEGWHEHEPFIGTDSNASWHRRDLHSGGSRTECRPTSAGGPVAWWIRWIRCTWLQTDLSWLLQRADRKYIIYHKWPSRRTHHII